MIDLLYTRWWSRKAAVYQCACICTLINRWIGESLKKRRPNVVFEPMLNQCCFNVDPSPTALAQHRNNIGLTPGVCWVTWPYLAAWCSRGRLSPLARRSDGDNTLSSNQSTTSIWPAWKHNNHSNSQSKSRVSLKQLSAIVRAHFSKRGILKVCKAFLSRICYAVVFTQFGYADSKSAPCQALFLVFPFQNCKTKWPSK